MLVRKADLHSAVVHLARLIDPRASLPITQNAHLERVDHFPTDDYGFRFLRNIGCQRAVGGEKNSRHDWPMPCVDWV